MTVALKKSIQLYSALAVFVGLQLTYWYKTSDIQMDMEIVPNVPGHGSLHAMAFGDDEFYFRTLAFTLQNSGDTYGRFSPLRYYDFNKLYQWFMLLDELDHHSDMMPSLASYYFSQTQNTADVRYIVDYLYAHAVNDVEHKWWWLIEATYLSMHKLENMELAIKMAKPLQEDHVPVWAREMTAIVYEKHGDLEDALHIMQTIKANVKNIPDKELRYMNYFVKQRIKQLDERQKKKDASSAPMDVK